MTQPKDVVAGLLLGGFAAVLAVAIVALITHLRLPGNTPRQPDGAHR